MSLAADTPVFLQRDMTPAYIFDLFFDDRVINYTVTMTNLYAMQKGKPTFSVTAGEIRGVLAILLFSGYVQLPSRLCSGRTAMMFTIQLSAPSCQ